MNRYMSKTDIDNIASAFTIDQLINYRQLESSKYLINDLGLKMIHTTPTVSWGVRIFLLA